MFYDENPDYEVKTSESKSNSLSSYLLFVDVYTSVYGDVDTTMNRSLDEYRSEVEYVYITYVKGMLLFDNIDEIIGREKFIKCLRKYFKERVYNTIIPRLIRLTEAPSHGKPILEYEPRSRGTLAYLNLAKEVIAKNGTQETSVR